MSCSLSAKTWVAITLGLFRAAIPDVCSNYSVEKGCAHNLWGEQNTVEGNKKTVSEPSRNDSKANLAFRIPWSFSEVGFGSQTLEFLKLFRKRATHYQVWFYLLKSFIEQIIWCFQSQLVTFNIDPMSKKLLDELKRPFLYLFISWIRRPWSDTLEE